MYCTREASERHDKVFALLGMSSDDPIAAGLSPDYGIPWEGLLERLVRYLLGEQVDVKTWPAMELAVIRSKGLILGHISSNHAGRDGRQQVAIALVDASGKLFSKIWSLPPSTESVEAGDLICLLGRATSPTIIRSQKDHFSVIMITTPPLEPTQSTSDILHDFLLLWDWEKSRESSRGRKEDTLWLGSQTVGYLDGMTASEMALISEDGGKYQKAEQEIHGIVGGHEARFGEEDTRTLTARVRLASIYLKTNRWLEAEELVQEVIQTRMRTQGTGHPDTARSRATLASIYRYRSGRYPNSQKMELFRRILERKAGEPPMTEEEVDEITRSNDIEQISLLLDQRADEIKITEAVLESVAGKCREAVMRRLLDRRGDEVRITESVLMGAAANTIDSQAMVKLLLDRGGDEVRITEAVLMKAVENEWSRTDEIVKLLLDRGGDEVEITEALLVSAVYNWRIAEELLLVLLDRGGAELKITRPVIEAAACNDFVSDGTMQLLYDRSQGSTARHRGRT
jgi:alkylhydroperoxidase family enzyme